MEGTFSVRGGVITYGVSTSIYPKESGGSQSQRASAAAGLRIKPRLRFDRVRLLQLGRHRHVLDARR
jgi:hypothetical protein